MRRLSNVQRSAETEANLARKLAHISELVARAQDGESIADFDYPTNMTEFREYENAARSLFKVGSPKILDRRQSPKRANFIDEVERKLAILATIKTVAKRPVKKASVTSQLARLKAERDDLKYQVGRLLGKVASLMDENRKLRTSVLANEKSKQLTSHTIKALNKKVVQLGGSLIKGVKNND